MKLALTLLAATTVFGKQKFFKRLDNFIGNVNSELNNAQKFIDEVKPQFEVIQNTIENVDLKKIADQFESKIEKEMTQFSENELKFNNALD